MKVAMALDESSVSIARVKSVSFFMEIRVFSMPTEFMDVRVCMLFETQDYVTVTH